MRLLKTALLSTTLMMFNTVSAAAPVASEMPDPTAAVPSTNAAVARLKAANTEFQKTVIDSLLDAIKAQTSSRSLGETAQQSITKLLEGTSDSQTKVSDVMAVLAGTFKAFKKSAKDERLASAKTLKGLNTELLTLTTELEAIESSAADVDVEISTYPAKSEETQREIAAKQHAVEETRVEFKKASEAKRQLVEEAQTALDTETGNLDALRNRIDSLQAQIGFLEKDEGLDPESLALLAAARIEPSPARTMDTSLFDSLNGSPSTSTPRADGANNDLTSDNLRHMPTTTAAALVVAFNTERLAAAATVDEPEAVTPTEEESGAAGNNKPTVQELTQQLSTLAEAVKDRELEAGEAFSNFKADAVTSAATGAVEDETTAAAQNGSNAEAPNAKEIKKLEAELAKAQAATTATPYCGKGSKKKNENAQAAAKTEVIRLTAEIKKLKA